jgi:hypothetical protein
MKTASRPVIAEKSRPYGSAHVPAGRLFVAEKIAFLSSCVKIQLCVL